ncbi:MAG: hypothetical protein EXQ87_03865 [Alphaproteobacteria bacterium]|nr:hypothetical protein [Alphaproteobacteria bacterium]
MHTVLGKLIVATVVGTLALAGGMRAAEAGDGYYRGDRGYHHNHHNHHRHGYHQPRVYYAPPPPVYYHPPPRVYYAPPPVYYAPSPRAYYAPPPAVFGTFNLRF